MHIFRSSSGGAERPDRPERPERSGRTPRPDTPQIGDATSTDSPSGPLRALFSRLRPGSGAKRATGVRPPSPKPEPSAQREVSADEVLALIDALSPTANTIDAFNHCADSIGRLPPAQRGAPLIELIDKIDTVPSAHMSAAFERCVALARQTPASIPAALDGLGKPLVALPSAAQRAAALDRLFDLAAVLPPDHQGAIWGAITTDLGGIHDDDELQPMLARIGLHVGRLPIEEQEYWVHGVANGMGALSSAQQLLMLMSAADLIHRWPEDRQDGGIATLGEAIEHLHDDDKWPALSFLTTHVAKWPDDRQGVQAALARHIRTLPATQQWPMLERIFNSFSRASDEARFWGLAHFVAQIGNLPASDQDAARSKFAQARVEHGQRFDRICDGVERMPSDERREILPMLSETTLALMETDQDEARARLDRLRL